MTLEDTKYYGIAFLVYFVILIILKLYFSTKIRNDEDS